MKKMSLSLVMSLLVLGFFFTPQKCYAPNPPPEPFTVQVTIAAACTFTATNLTFSNTYDPTTGNNNTAQTIFTTTCTNGTNYHLNFNSGVNSGGASNYNTQQMANGGAFVTYNLYIDDGHVSLWGDGTNGSVFYDSSTTYSGNPPTTGTGVAQNLTVYGRITPGAQPTAGPGTYTDTVTASLTVP